MALLQMQRIFIYALKKEGKKILEHLQRYGVVEVSDLVQEDDIFQKADTLDKLTASSKNIETVEQALKILSSYIPEKKSMFSSLSGRKEIFVKDYENFKSKYETVLEKAYNIISLSKSIAESNAEKIKLQTQIEILTPWKSLDIPLDFAGTKETKSFIGTLPGEWSLEEIYERLSEVTPINIDIISSYNRQTSIFVLSPKNKAGKVFEALRSIEFALPSLKIDRSPAEELEHLKKLLREADNKIKEAEDEIRSYDNNREELLFLQDYERMKSDQYDVLGRLIQSKNVFIISGFVPEKEGARVAKELESKFDVVVELKETTEQDEVPVLYQNNGFSAPLEGVVNSYSPPSKGEIDPTTMMALFYYALFGLMLSDAGYGLLMVIVCSFALLKFRKTIETPMKNNLKMFLFCGIATIFWGILFGSYFGDLIDIVAVNFFGVNNVPIIPPLWFYPVEKPMLMLTFSMAIGILHLLTGLSLQGYQYAKDKDYKAIIYDVGLWLTLLISCILLLLSMDMVTDILSITVIIHPMVLKVSKILAIVSAIGIVLTNGRESKNPFKRLLKGAYSLYGISGYLSDVLSYSRLLALGLATGVIASVINQMAAMIIGGFLGSIIFIIVVIIGHLINFAINALGSYVHTNRLQYVEFFGKFYEGGGKLFKPFGINTKYYKFKEKMKNEY